MSSFFVFRVDASLEIGTGHVMRCLTLADELKTKGYRCLFITRPHSGHMAGAITRRGHEVSLLSKSINDFLKSSDDVAQAAWLRGSWENDAHETIETLVGTIPNWLVVDHYAIDQRWQKLLRSHVEKIIVIDDLADRELDCDLLLDQTLGRKESDYHDQVNKGCRMLMGSRYALLRPEFLELRQQAITRRKAFDGVKRILVSMGGTDPHNVTAVVLDALLQLGLPTETTIDVVLGEYATHFKEIKEQSNKHSLEISVSKNVNDLAMRMLGADLAIGASGSTSWERCCLGLPALTISVAENQKIIAREIAKAGASIHLGDLRLVTSATIRNIVQSLIEQTDVMLRMSERCFCLVDGLGTSRMVKEIKAIS